MKTLIFLLFVLILPQSLCASETTVVDQDGFIGTDRLSAKSVIRGNQTLTTGYINNQPLRLKTQTTATGTITTGWVNGRYVRIKETPKARKD